MLQEHQSNREPGSAQSLTAAIECRSGEQEFNSCPRVDQLGPFFELRITKTLNEQAASVTFVRFKTTEFYGKQRGPLQERKRSTNRVSPHTNGSRGCHHCKCTERLRKLRWMEGWMVEKLFTCDQLKKSESRDQSGQFRFASLH